MPQLDSDPPPAAAQRASRGGFWQAFAAVFTSFLGIRKKAAGERDIMSIKPLHFILAGLLGAAILVIVVLALVRFITRAG